MIGVGGLGGGINVNQQLWIIQKSNKSIRNNSGRLYMHVYYTHYKPRNLFLGFIYKNLLLNHLWSCVLKLLSELPDIIWFGIVFHRDAPENEKLV